MASKPMPPTPPEMVEMYVSGVKVDLIRARFGVCATTVRKHMKRAGVKLRPIGGNRPPNALRKCWLCKEYMLPEKFTRNSKLSLQRGRVCKECSPRYQNERRLLQTYGLTKEAFAAKLAGQGGVCAICNTATSRYRKTKEARMAVDHCHKTGQIRGLLCANCNAGLGMYQDRPDLLRKAALYLERYQTAWETSNADYI